MDPEGGDNRLLQNIGTYLQMNMASYKDLNLHQHHYKKLKSWTKVPSFTKTKDLTTLTEFQQGIIS
jgi:hypothetical protein